VESQVGGVPGAAALGGGRAPREEGADGAPVPGDRSARGDGRASALLAADAEASIGAYLRTQRELRDIGLDELEAVTRIPRRSLERLEAGEYDARPDGFVRSFVRAVAVALGLDPDEAVTRMLPEPAAPPPRAGLGWAAGRLAAVAALLLVLAAGAVWWGLEAEGGGAGAGAGSGPGAGAGVVADADPPVVWRRDPVRSLAEAAARGEGPEARLAPLLFAPLPNPVEVAPPRAAAPPAPGLASPGRGDPGGAPR